MTISPMGEMTKTTQKAFLVADGEMVGKVSSQPTEKIERARVHEPNLRMTAESGNLETNGAARTESTRISTKIERSGQLLFPILAFHVSRRLSFNQYHFLTSARHVFIIRRQNICDFVF